MRARSSSVTVVSPCRSNWMTCSARSSLRPKSSRRQPWPRVMPSLTAPLKLARLMTIWSRVRRMLPRSRRPDWPDRRSEAKRLMMRHESADRRSRSNQAAFRRWSTCHRRLPRRSDSDSIEETAACRARAGGKFSMPAPWGT